MIPEATRPAPTRRPVANTASTPVAATRRLPSRGREGPAGPAGAPVSFRVLAESGGARLVILETAHGPVETPAFMPVATRGAIRGLTSRGVGGRRHPDAGGELPPPRRCPPPARVVSPVSPEATRRPVANTASTPVAATRRLPSGGAKAAPDPPAAR